MAVRFLLTEEQFKLFQPFIGMLGSQALASWTVEEINEDGPSVNDSMRDTLEYTAEQLLAKKHKV